MTATTCPSADNLRALSLGQLPSELSDDLVDHIRVCEACKSDLDTIEDSEDSLIASLRHQQPPTEFEAEPDCKLALAKALGALALVDEIDSQAAPDSLPSHIGEYEIIRPLGRGGMGSVFLAKHTKLGRQVALKILATHRLSDPRVRERFESEMRAVGKLSHPNIVTAHDAREVDGNAVLVTEYIDGMDLGQLLARTGPLPIADACEIARLAAVALQYTHLEGFVHRDIKPSNIMLSSSGEVKLLDLGLARFHYDDPEQAEITRTGQVMGTADYVAPEQVTDSRRVDIRADIYALGCTLFKLLAGRAPFADEQHLTTFAKMTAHVSIEPPSLKACLPDAPAGLAQLVDSMLAKEPSRRPQTPEIVARSLKSFSTDARLGELAARADKLTPTRPTSLETAGTSPQVAARTQSLLWRPVPLVTAIAAGLLGTLLGLCLGVILTIKNPDGSKTTMMFPDGSSFEFSQAEPNNPLGGDSAAGAEVTEAAALALPTEPLALAVLVGPESDRRPHLSTAQIEQLRTQLQQHREGTVVENESGRWVPLSRDVRVPIDAWNNGKRYALVSTESPHAIPWEAIQGHVARVGSVRLEKGQTILELGFDETLAKRMEQLSSENRRKRLAIIVEGQIVATPYINSTISRQVQLSFAVEPEQVERLQRAFRGAVEPVAEGALDRFQGFWQVVAAMDSGHDLQIPDTAMAFDGQNFYVAEGSRLNTHGKFLLGQDGDSRNIDFRDEPNGPSINLGIYRFLPGNLLQICMNERPQGGRPTGFESVGGTANDVLMTLKRTGEFPLDPAEMPSWLDDGSLSSAEAIRTILKTRSSTADPGGTPAKKVIVATKLAKTRNHLKRMGIAFQHFHDVFKKFPGSANLTEEALLAPGKKTYPFSWRVAILPFIEHDELYQEYRFDEPWDSEHNLTLLEKMPELYRSPFADEGQDVGETNYLGYAGDRSALGAEDGIRLRDIPDGTSNTLLIIDAGCTVPWTKPMDIPFEALDDVSLATLHDDDGPLNYLTADGGVHSMQPVDWQRLGKLVTRAGGEQVQP